MITTIKGFFVVCFMLLIWSGQSFAWSKQGHLIIASMAYNKLTPKAKKRAVQLLSHLSHDSGRKAFVNSSTWADDIKQKNITAYNRWHYIRLPIISSHFYSPFVPVPNVLTASKAQAATLMSAKYSEHEKAWALRMLIHLVGDLHQPLHVATKYDKRFPKGDLNGLKYTLRSRYKNLHRYWDLGGGLLVFKKKSVYKRKALLTSLLKKQTTSSGELQGEIDEALSSWVDNSFNLAEKYGYKQASTTAIKPSYRNSVKRISKQQLTKAGLHLAQALNKIL